MDSDGPSGTRTLDTRIKRSGRTVCGRFTSSAAYLKQPKTACFCPLPFAVVHPCWCQNWCQTRKLRQIQLVSPHGALSLARTKTCDTR